MLFERARTEPNGLALDDGARTRTWAELEDRATRIAHLLRDELGVAPGAHAAMLVENRAECVELTLGAMLAGVWLTPVNWHLTADEVAYVVRDSGARVVFTSPRYQEITRTAGAPNHVLVGEPLDRALRDVSDAPFPADGPSGGTMIYTSGTTGRPKGVKRVRPGTLAAALEAARAAGRRIGLDGSGPHLVTGPMYHAAPLLFAVYDQLCGAPVVSMPRWSEAQALALLREREIVHTHLVPTMFVRLLRLPEEEREGFHAPALEVVLHGAAPIAPRVKQRMIEWWGPVLVEYWGATESGVVTLVDSATWLERPGTVGRALEAFEVFAVNEAGERLPPGEVGSLYCRHRSEPELFTYHQAPEKTGGAYLEQSTFTIGDVGCVDAEGFVHLADRQSHTIISGGVNVYPAEIEQILLEHPAVADVGVFGIPDEEWGEQVKAAIELREGTAPTDALERELLEFAARHLARYKVPRSIDFEAKLPREPSGKLYIRRLREPYWQHRDRQI